MHIRACLHTHTHGSSGRGGRGLEELAKDVHEGIGGKGQRVLGEQRAGEVDGHAAVAGHDCGIDALHKVVEAGRQVASAKGSG
jgi:hypothetical protein